MARNLTKATTQEVQKTQEIPGWLHVAAKCIIGAAAFCCLMTFCYFFYMYGLTNNRQFTNWIGPLLYYVTPALLCLVLCGALLLKSPHSINLAVVLVAVCVGVYGCELFVIGFSEGAGSIVRKLYTAYFDIDTRSRLEVIQQLSKEGTYAVPAVTPSMQMAENPRHSSTIIAGKEVLPLGGIANTLTVFCTEGKYVFYESDQYGFHNPKAVWHIPQLDIVAVGDSFTQGVCVPSEMNLVGLIRKRYPATLNLGMSGNGPLLMLSGLKEYAAALRPKVVLWVYYEGNDLEELQLEAQNPFLMQYLQEEFTQDLRSQQPEIDAALTAYVEKEKEANRWGWHSQYSGFLHMLSVETIGFLKLSHLRRSLGLMTGRKVHTSPTALPLELFAQTLAEAEELVSAWGGTMYYVYLPAGGRYLDPDALADSTDSAQYIAALNARDEVLEIVKHLEIPLIDIHPVFEAQSDPLSVFPRRLPDRHYNERGYRLAAEEILRTVAVDRP